MPMYRISGIINTPKGDDVRIYVVEYKYSFSTMTVRPCNEQHVTQIGITKNLKQQFTMSSMK